MTFTGELRSFQNEAFSKMVENAKVLVAYRMGLGKALANSEPVLTPNGWCPIETIQIGDWVIGSDGRPTEVIGVFPQGEKEIARVTMADGSWSRVTWDHLWRVQHVRNGRWRTMTTREIFAGRIADNSGNRNWRLPLVASVQFVPSSPARVLPVDPYLLGLWLGNGSTYTISFDVRDEEVAKQITSTGSIKEREEGTSWVGRVRNDVRQGLQDLVIFHCRSSEKYIPKRYQHAGPADRLALLQGLLDTDGSPISGGGVEYSSVSEKLLDGVIDLVESLGGVARNKTSRVPSFTYRGEKRKGQKSWRVNIKLPAELDPFRSSRKLNLWQRPTKYKPTRIIAGIEPDGSEDATCIKVAAPDGLFVTRRHIVTHNTPISIATIEELMDNKEVASALIVVMPASIKWQWRRQIQKFADPGKYGRGAQVVVVEGTPEHRVSIYRRIKQGKYEYVVMNYEQIVADWEIVRFLDFDAIVFDEITALKNPGSERTKYCRRLVEVLNPAYCFGLTGQPIETRAEDLFHIMHVLNKDILGSFEEFDRRYISRKPNGQFHHSMHLNELRERLEPFLCRKTRDDVKDQMPAVVEEDYIVDFDAASKRVYEYIADDLLETLRTSPRFSSWNVWDHYSGATDNSPQGQISARLTAMRMLCDHPALLTLSAKNFDDPHSKAGSAYAKALTGFKLLENPPAISAKMKDTLDLITEILDADPKNKIVLFSFFKPMLKLIGAKLKVGHGYYTGDIPGRIRDETVGRFEKERNFRVLLSSDAGGRGLDLPMANYLISYDLPWSSGLFEQRKTRIDRLSSEFPEITMINMIMRASIEEWMIERLEGQQSVASAWLDGKGVSRSGKHEFSVSSLTRFLERRLA